MNVRQTVLFRWHIYIFSCTNECRSKSKQSDWSRPSRVNLKHPQKKRHQKHKQKHKKNQSLNLETLCDAILGREAIHATISVSSLLVYLISILPPPPSLSLSLSLFWHFHQSVSSCIFMNNFLSLSCFCFF
jgi:hypothetical protein